MMGPYSKLRAYAFIEANQPYQPLASTDRNSLTAASGSSSSWPL